jgi:hypothetical protein
MNADNTLPGQRQAEAATLSSQLTQALSIIQGVALTHHSTKAFLGRKYPLDVRHSLLSVSPDAHIQRLGVAGPARNFASFSIYIPRFEAVYRI